jgi:DNA repair protein RadC
MCESTNAERPGYTPSEHKIAESLVRIFDIYKDKRIVIATFSSNVHRIQHIISNSVKCGRKVAVTGRSMINIVSAAVELGKRIWTSGMEYRPVIHCSEDAAKLLMGRFRGLDREHFMVVLLNQKHVVITTETISIGTINGAMVHPREVFKQAIKRSAAAMILVHNHPSGVCEPSEQDLLVTERLKEVGQIIGIDVIDHIIIGEDTYYSFCENQIF